MAASSPAAAGGIDVAGGEHDLDERGEHRRARELPATLFDHAADGCDRGVQLPLGQPQEGEPGCRFAALFAGRAIRPLGFGQVAAQAMELSLLVERESRARDGRVRTAVSSLAPTP